MIVDNPPKNVHKRKEAARLSATKSSNMGRSRPGQIVTIADDKTRAGIAGGSWELKGEAMTLIEDRLRRPPSDADIVERVVTAVMEQKLGAGAKLPEAALCEAFDCSRTQIRRVLVVLAERGVVTLHPNRGAFVASPDADEARDVFEARRAIERSIVLAAAKRIERPRSPT